MRTLLSLSSTERHVRQLNDPGDLEGYACEAKHRASGSVYKARYRVSRQATWPNSGTTSSTTDMSRTNNVQYVVNILPTTPEVVIGQQYSMTCEVTPNPTQPVSYTWHYKDRVFQTGPQLTIDAVDFEEVGKYTCQAQWMSGEGYSAGGGMESNATVELNLALTQSQEIDLSSTSTSVMVAMEGVFKELHCEYDHANPGRVQWFFRGEVLEASPTLNVTGRVYRIDRQLVSIIAIKQTEMRHQGLYECLVDGVTKRAQLIIRSDAGLHVNPPEQTVNVGEPAEIHCRIERANEINRELEWFFRPFDGSYTEPINFALPDGFRREDNPVTTQTSFIAIQRARKSDEGEYVCRHPPSGKENVGLLYVLDKGRPQTHRVYITPQIVRVRVEQSISIECYVTDESGQTINYLPTYRVRDNRVVYHTEPIGPNRVRLDISRGLTREFNGTQIECYSEATGVTTTTIIIIEDMCPPDYRRCLSGQCLMSGRFCDGVRDCDDGSDEDSRLCAACDPISKRCGEYGGRQPSKNTYMIHWTCDGEDDCGNGFDESSCSAYAGSKCSESMFRCPNEQRQIPWSFVCDKENDCSGGDDERNCGPPVIQTPQESNHRVRQGSTISMTCRVTGNPIPFVIWRFNWNCLPDEGGRFRINNVAEACGSSVPTVVSTLTITNVQPGDDGIYNCEGLSGLNRALSVDYRLMLEY